MVHLPAFSHSVSEMMGNRICEMPLPSFGQLPWSSQHEKYPVPLDFALHFRPRGKCVSRTRRVRHDGHKPEPPMSPDWTSAVAYQI